MTDELRKPFGIKKPAPPPVAVSPMKWQCRCGCRNWSHQRTCASCGEVKPNG